MIKKIKLLIIIICSLLLFSTFSINLSKSVGGDQVNKCLICSNSNHKYIIIFQGESLSEFKTKLDGRYFDIISSLNKDSIKDIIDTEFSNYRYQIIKMHNIFKDTIEKLLGSKDIIIEEFYNVINGVVISGIHSDIIQVLEKLPYVKSVTESKKVKYCVSESISLIRADMVQELTDSLGRNITGENITIALIDSGFDYSHPDLIDNIWVNPGEDLNDNGIVDSSDFNGLDDDNNGLVDDILGWDFVTCDYFEKINGEWHCSEYKSEDNDPMDDLGHGTHCAGILQSVAPNIKIAGYKVLNRQGMGDDYWTIKALDIAADPNNDGDFSDHFDIASISLGGEFAGSPDDLLSEAVDNAVSRGIVVVAAAGNSGGDYTIVSPGCARKSICVGASYKSDSISGQSSRGPVYWKENYIVKPDVVAPGVIINSCKLGGGYTTKSGTSMATPHVAGVAALILQKHPDWNPEMIKMAIRNAAVDIGENITTQGFGRIDAYNSVNIDDKPPIAFLNLSKRMEQGQTKIYGTAKADNYQNSTLYYYDEADWKKICTIENQIDDGLICSWNTMHLTVGKTYMIKLEVKSLNQSSVDIGFINLKNPNQNIFINTKTSVNEQSMFWVNLTDKEDKPVNAFIIFIAPYKIPQIKYGSNILFKTPRVINPLKTSIKGKIYIFRILTKEIIYQNVTIINSKYSYGGI